MKANRFYPAYTEGSKNLNKYTSEAKNFIKIMMASFDQNEELANSKKFKDRIDSAILNGDLENSLEDLEEFVKKVKVTTF